MNSLNSPTPSSGSQPQSYEALRKVFTAFLTVYNRLEVTGVDHLPPAGQGALLCANHDNYSDPFVLAAAASTRYVRFVGWAEAFTWPVIGPFAKAMGGIQVPSIRGRAASREGAAASLRTVADALQQGELVALFPEGRIKPWVGGDALMAFKTGAVRAAAMADRPIVPAGLYGTRFVVPNVLELERGPQEKRRAIQDVWAPVPLPAKVMVAFGPPLTIATGAATDKTVAVHETERLRKAIFALRHPLKQRHPLGWLP